MSLIEIQENNSFLEMAKNLMPVIMAYFMARDPFTYMGGVQQIMLNPFVMAYLNDIIGGVKTKRNQSAQVVKQPQPGVSNPIQSFTEPFPLGKLMLLKPIQTFAAPFPLGRLLKF
jgi:hypothetical protein